MGVRHSLFLVPDKMSSGKYMLSPRAFGFCHLCPKLYDFPTGQMSQPFLKLPLLCPHHCSLLSVCFKPWVKSCHLKRWRKVSMARGCLLWQCQQMTCRKDDFLSTIPVISFYFPSEHQYKTQLSKSPRSSHLFTKITSPYQGV